MLPLFSSIELITPVSRTETSLSSAPPAESFSAFSAGTASAASVFASGALLLPLSAEALHDASDEIKCHESRYPFFHTELLSLVSISGSLSAAFPMGEEPVVPYISPYQRRFCRCCLLFVISAALPWGGKLMRKMHPPEGLSSTRIPPPSFCTMSRTRASPIP